MWGYPPLAEHFLTRYVLSQNKRIDGFSKTALKRLLQYDYPGNVRELDGMMEQAVIQCQTGQIKPEHIILTASPEMDTSTSSDPEDMRVIFLKTLEQTRWNRSAAARKLGMPYSKFMYRSHKLGL